MSDRRHKPSPAGGVLCPGEVPKGSYLREGAVGSLAGVTRIALTRHHTKQRLPPFFEQLGSEFKLMFKFPAPLLASLFAQLLGGNEALAESPEVAVAP